MNLANISHQKKIKQKKRGFKEKIRFFENDFFKSDYYLILRLSLAIHLKEANKAYEKDYL